METFLLIVVLALVALALVLHVELKTTQRRVEDLSGDVTERIRRSLTDVAEPMAKIPQMEKRLQDVERGVANLQPLPTTADPSDRGAAAPVQPS